MMECWVTTGGGEKLTLPESVRWELCHGTGVPCDSFFVRCLWESGQERLMSGACRFYAQWEGERVFTGVVDEFACLCGADGLYLEMSGRGMAALLLDNEAMPAQYQLATRSDLVADHVSPYGVEAVGGWSLPAVSGFTVGSGVSEWSVVQEFACYHGGVVPRFDRWGRLVLDPHQDGGAGLRLTDAVPLTAWEYREERHGVLSQVAVRRRSSWDTPMGVRLRLPGPGGLCPAGGDGAQHHRLGGHALLRGLSAAGLPQRPGAVCRHLPRSLSGLAGGAGGGGPVRLRGQRHLPGGPGGDRLRPGGAGHHPGAGGAGGHDLRVKSGEWRVEIPFRRGCLWLLSARAESNSPFRAKPKLVRRDETRQSKGLAGTFRRKSKRQPPQGAERRGDTCG